MRVKVFNDNKVQWVETFKGEVIKIPPQGFVEMEFFEAHEFKGQFSPIKIKADETQDPDSFKMIRVEQLSQESKDEIEDEVFQCNLCKKTYLTQSALLKHSTQHADQVVIDHDAERAVPKKRGRPPKSQEVLHD